MGEVVNIRAQQSDRERVVDIVDMYNVWAKAKGYRTCPLYRMSRHIASGKANLTTFLQTIAQSTIDPTDFAMVLKEIEGSVFLQTLIKIDNLFYWLFKQRDGSYNFTNVVDGQYKDRAGHKEGQLAYATPEEANKIMDKGFFGMGE